MKLLNLAKESIVTFVQGLRRGNNKAWWIEIITIEPPCLYYFGPFKDLIGAIFNCFGYVIDLSEERTKGITVTFKRCNPKILTVCAKDCDREED